jgi:hypothetical protein
MVGDGVAGGVADGRREGIGLGLTAPQPATIAMTAAAVMALWRVEALVTALS